MKISIIWIIGLIFLIPVAQGAVSDGLLVCLDFDNSDATDSSGNGNDFTELGNPTYADSDNGGKHIVLDGSGDALTRPNFIPNGSKTIAFHAEKTGVSGITYFIHSGLLCGAADGEGVCIFILDTASDLRPSIGDDVVPSDQYLTVNTGFGIGQNINFHYLLTIDNVTSPFLNMSINNETKGVDTTKDNNEGGTNSNVSIGVNTVGGTGFFPGIIDNYAVWGRTLTSTERALVASMGSCDDITVVPLVDTEAPFFNESSINNSNPRINEVVGLSQLISDNVSLSTAIFFHNQTGTFINQTPISISGQASNVTFDLTITLGRGNVIASGWFANDTSGNVNISNLTIFEIANTPPTQATILTPTAGFRTNVQPTDINVTFASDADGDVITINYYINGTLNQSLTTNTTLEASDNLYQLNVDLNDGVDSSANVSVLFTIDTTDPVITITNPVNGSTLSANIAVDISCTDLNPFLLNYSLFNATSDLERTIQQNESIGNTLTITDTIPIENLTDGVFTLNITCSDTHTTKAIEDYFPFKDLGNLKLFYTIKEDLVGIKLKSTTATLDDFGTFRETDKYIFWFDFIELETSTIYEYVFKIDNKEDLKYLSNSDFNAHFITKNNWIDFEFDGNDDATYTIKQTQDNKYEIKIKTTKTFLNFESIGGLNIVTSQVTFTLDTTVAPVVPTPALPLEGIANLVAIFVLFVVAVGLYFKFFRGK